MKATELMIGDLVRVSKDVSIKKGTIVEIRAIDADREFHELKGCAICVPVDNPDGLSGGVWVDYLEPISLTPEVLEKNGFEKTWQDNFVYDNEDIGLIITFHPKETNYTNGTYDYIDIEKGCVTITEMPIEFVHQLQHGLRLCEVSIEIIEL